MTKENEAEFAEEVLAEFAENNDFSINIWNRIAAIIRKWVRKLLPNWDLKLSDNDIRYILLGLQRKLKRAPARVPPIPTLDDLEKSILFPPSAAAGVTTKFLSQLHSPSVIKMLHKGTLTQGQYRSIAKRHAGSAAERDLILSVLDSYTSLRLYPDEVEQAIIDKLVLFDTYVDTQAEYVDFALPGTIEKLYASFRKMPPRSKTTIQPQFVIFNDRHQDVPFKSGHYQTEPFYRGHIRGFLLWKVADVGAEYTVTKIVPAGHEGPSGR